MQLFTPFELAGKRLRNRIVFPAVLSNFARENRVTPRLVDYYAERAAGGAAMLVTEGLAIHASSVPQPNVATVFDAANFEGFQRLAAAVERHDCRLLGQLWHVGRQQLWSPVDAPVGVSALPDAYSWSVPHVMTPDEIGVIARAFVDAARTLQRAGFSGVELHGGHGYLITQFLSPWSNTRDDAYGGDVEGRTRFVREMIAGIRAECGAGFIVGLKMPGDERVPGGIDGDEAGRIAARLAAAGGLDYVAFAQGNFSPSLEDHTPDMHYPPGPFMALQRRLREHARPMPVLALGRVLDAAHAEQLLGDGVGDLIGMGRALVADAALPAKALAGKAAATRPCIFCNVCWAEIHVGKPIACIHNPHLGTPGEAAWQPAPAGRKRRIVVVGSGVAGPRGRVGRGESRPRRDAARLARGGRQGAPRIAPPGARRGREGVRVPARARPRGGRRLRIGPARDRRADRRASPRRGRPRDRIEHAPPGDARGGQRNGHGCVDARGGPRALRPASAAARRSSSTTTTAPASMRSPTSSRRAMTAW